MNPNDINRAFTEKVTELLNRGYQIYPGTMSGSQGEIAHVDLYKGNEIIRVLLDHCCGSVLSQERRVAYECCGKWV